MKQFSYCLFLSVFLLASCQKKADAGDSDVNPAPTQTVQFDLSGMTSDAIASLSTKDLTFLFYLDGELLLQTAASLGEDNATDVDVPLDEATQLIVIAGGAIKNAELLNTLEITTGTGYDQEVFATPITNVQTNGNAINLSIDRLVGKVGIRPTDSSEELQGASFNALDVIFNNVITSYRPGAEEQQHTYETITRRVTSSNGYQADIMSFTHPSDATDEEYTRIDLDYFSGATKVGQMNGAQPLSGITVKASVFTVLELPLTKSMSPVSGFKSMSAEMGEISVMQVEF